jgi:hypothetical protein
MIRVCAWCSRTMGEKPGPENVITHGICPACSDEVFGSSSQLSVERFLDRIEIPVFLMDDDARVLAGNAMGAELLGKASDVTEGAYAGDAVDCAHAGLPGGCGKTSHCQDCTLRATIEHTFQTGQSHSRVRTTLQRAGASDDIDLDISTEKVGRGVLLRLDEVA